VNAGPFSVGFAPISHSIPESSGLVIDTPEGRLVHTGDFKIDLDPVVGEPFDRALWESIGAGGVKALICDSTNVFSVHQGRSESSVGQPITELVEGCRGMVVATTFASNVARVRTLAEAGLRAGRAVCLMGRAMNRMVEAARATGVLADFPATIPPEEAAKLPRESVMLIVTGSQGERRAASAQLANGKYNGIRMKEGDTFLFSSKTIPGNERGVIRIMNQFSEQGVDVIEGDDHYHVSGHANRPDLDAMHHILRPQILIPMHGEHRHLREHVKLAKSNRIAGIVAVNGMMIDLGGNAPTVAEYIETGRTYLDGTVRIGAMDGIVRDRIRMALNGHVMVNVILDEDNAPLGEPWVEIMGLPETGRSRAPLVDVLEDVLAQFMARAGTRMLADDGKLEEGLRRVARQSTQTEIGKRPEATVVITRLTE
jgi:ribonuclease J